MGNTVENQRKLWLDALRAIAIIFVVIVHTIQWNKAATVIYNVFVGPIMIPLFFAISGYLFSDRGGNQLAFYKKLLRGVIIPCLFLSLVWARALLIPLKGVSYFLDYAMALLSGEEHWFLIAYIIAQILFFYTRKFFNAVIPTCIVSGLIFSAGIILASLDIGNFAMFNRACIAQAYLLMGFLFRIHEQKLSKLQWRHILCGIGIYLLMGVLSLLIWPQQYLDVHINRYYNLPYCMAMIFIGCVTAFLVARKINVSQNLLVYIGQNTFVIYALHAICIVAFQKALSFLKIELSNTLWLTAIKVCFAIAACCVIAFILNKFTPELVGKKRSLKKVP